MAIVYSKTKNAKYAARTNYFNIIHISVRACRQNNNKLARYVLYYASSRVTVKSKIL